MARPTRRGWGLLLVTLGTYLTARLLGTWELYLVSLAFLVAVAVSWVLVQVTARALVVSRALDPPQPLAGDTLRIRVDVANGSVLPGLQVTVHDVAGSLGDGAPPLDFVSMPSRGGLTAVAGPWLARRGVHRLPGLRVDAEDPLGLVGIALKPGTTLGVTIYPRLVSLRSCSLLTDVGSRLGQGRQAVPTLGAAELRGIRPHNPGEPLNHVDWKATARTGQLMLREMDDPTTGDISIVLDASASRVTGSPPDTNFEVAVRVAGSVAACALGSGTTVVFLRQDDGWRPARLAPQGDGRRRLLDLLARAATHDDSPTTPSLQALLDAPAPTTRSRVLTLVVLGLDERLRRSIEALRRSGARIAVVHVAGSGFAGVPATTDERAQALALQAAGVPCLTVRKDDDLRAALSAQPSSPHPVRVS